MAFKLKLTYPSGEEEILEEEYESEAEAESEGMEQANAYSIGAEVLEDACMDYCDESLEWEVIKE